MNRTLLNLHHRQIQPTPSFPQLASSFAQPPTSFPRERESPRQPHAPRSTKNSTPHRHSERSEESLRTTSRPSTQHRLRLIPTLILALLLPTIAQAQSARVIQNITVFKEDGRFGGWPANNGIWNWGDEIVVGFTLGYYKQNPTGGHDIDGDKPSTVRQARSTDGGLTWETEKPTFLDENEQEAAPAQLETAIDFGNPHVALRFREGNFYYSPDRARTWHGPYELPKFGRPGLLARTDYIIEGANRVTAFVAAQKEGGGEGQPLAIRTTDGGLTWNLLGWIGEQPPESYGYAIMSATVSVPGDGYYTMIRRGGVFDGKRRWWIEPYLSPDDGHSWHLLDEPYIDNAGNPATLTRLQDGRIAMAYGWRTAPYGIRGRISGDNGQTWSDEFILRQDGASWDIGYPRTIERADGNLVTIYYYHDIEKALRYIAGTIWKP